LKVVFSPQADAEADRALDWWLENRDKAPQLFEQELARAIAKLKETPRIGQRILTRGLNFEVRFLLLPKTRFRLFYRVLPEADLVEILRLWHTSRGAEPDL
jgi:plasmid stabilization system protein ParE